MKKQVLKKLPGKFTFVSVGIICIVVALIGFYYVDSLMPVNSDSFAFGVPENLFIKVVTDSDGKPFFAVQNTKGGKVVPGINHTPNITISKDSLVAFHIINEVKNTQSEKSLYDFHIDEFNIHSDNLGYFQTDTITFVADKTGTFEFYSSLHPEMRGTIQIR